MLRCDGCGLAMLDPQPDDATLEHLFYFNRRTIARLLGDCGFESVVLRPG